MFPDEALILVPRLLDTLIKLRQALVESSAAYPSARHKLLQPVPLPQHFPVRELSI